MSHVSHAERIAINLFEICASMNYIQLYIEGMSEKDFLEDTKTQDAISIRFISIGESANKIKQVDAHFIERHSHVPWQKMSAFRNIIAHDYYNVKPSMAWETIKEDIPALKIDLKQMIEKKPEIKALLLEEIQANKQHKCTMFD